MKGRQRSDEEFEQFVGREYDRLRRVAVALTGNSHDAEDLLQETLTKLLVRWGKVTAADSPTRYAHRTMVNTFLSGKRRRASTEVVSSEVVGLNTSSSDPTSDFVQRDDLLSAVLRLPPNQRVVIVLRYLEDLPASEVADILGKREGAVRATCHRGLENLRGKTDSRPRAAISRAARAGA